MTEDQTFDHPNEYRKRFYDEVINETKDVSFHDPVYFSEDDNIRENLPG
jgi:hypothetical protein